MKLHPLLVAKPVKNTGSLEPKQGRGLLIGALPLLLTLSFSVLALLRRRIGR